MTRRVGRNLKMQTLHEYMMETKAVEYVMAVIFLAVFTVFWKYLADRPSKQN